ncbi:hypothetical protein ACOMHN_058558 [Nucella lapillus]
MSQPTPQTKADVIQAALRKDWRAVFDGMGCRLYLKRQEGRTSSVDPNASWAEILQAVKSDFWGKKIRLSKGREVRDSLATLTRQEVLDSGVFPSLLFELRQSSITLREIEEHDVIGKAMQCDDWAALTLILFLFCGQDGVGVGFAKALKKAVLFRDWRYVDALGVDFTSYHMLNNVRFLEVLGLRGIVHQQQVRNEVVHRLLGNPEWDAVVLDIVVKAMVGMYLDQLRGDDLRTWTTVFQFVSDFDCETEVNKEFITKCLQQCCGRSITAKEVLDLAQQEHKPYLLRGLNAAAHMTYAQIKKAVTLAYLAKDWRTFITYPGGPGILDRSKFPFGADELFELITLNDFRMTPDLKPDDVNATRQGLTLLHVAVDRWREDCGGHIMENIMFLMESKFSVNVRDPSGWTVVQKLMDKPGAVAAERKGQRQALINCIAGVAFVDDVVIDWTPAPHSEWSALHVLCDEGGYQDIQRIIRLHADPCRHRRGLTLFDTTLMSATNNLYMLQKTCDVLVAVPGLLQDHVATVSSRPAVQDSEYRFPLMHLLSITKIDRFYLAFIRYLHSRQVFTDVELREAKKDVTINAFLELGYDDVVHFIRNCIWVSVHDYEGPTL